MIKLHGIFPPIATPFDHKGDLYKVKVQHNVEKWNKTGLGGYVVCGSTGESVYLTTEEKVTLWEWVAQYASPDKLLMAAHHPQFGDGGFSGRKIKMMVDMVVLQ